MLFTLASVTHHELVIKKSRFLACLEPMADRAGAQARVAQLRAEHPGATHVCWALLAGGQSAAVDDGEPGGTAGRPMLEVLRHQQLEAVLATVVRYFGGVKLGAGGLLRAYTDSVAQALLQARKIPLVARQRLCCALPYALEGRVRRELDSAGARLLEARHGSVVTLRFEMAQDAALACAHRLDDIGQGRLVWLPAQEDGAAEPGRPA